jgi:Protein of unknown function (DUF3800)
VLALLSGMPETRRRRRLLVVFQAYIDDSEDENVLVLAGYIAPFEVWTTFTEWDKQLKIFDMGPFKMREMAQNNEGMYRAEIFYRIIERHIKAAISCTIDKSDLIKVVGELARPLNVFDIDKLTNPFFAAFTRIIKALPEYQESMGISDPVDFIFDDRTEKTHVMDAWDLMKASAHPVTRRFMGANPRFEKDDDFPPLQAADLFVWWVRRWESEGQYDLPRNKPPAFPWGIKQEMLHLHIRYREQELREELEPQLRDQRALFLARQSNDVLREIDEARLYEEESFQARARTSLRSRLLRFLGRFR